MSVYRKVKYIHNAVILIIVVRLGRLSIHIQRGYENVSIMTGPGQDQYTWFGLH